MTRTTIRVLTGTGLHFMTGLEDADASAVGQHWNAVRHYLDTGNTTALSALTGTTVTGLDETGQCRRIMLETDPDVIELAAIRGDVRFDAIYDEVQ